MESCVSLNKEKRLKYLTKLGGRGNLALRFKQATYPPSGVCTSDGDW